MYEIEVAKIDPQQELPTAEESGKLSWKGIGRYRNRASAEITLWRCAYWWRKANPGQLCDFILRIVYSTPGNTGPR